jgi:hypothetical protein
MIARTTSGSPSDMTAVIKDTEAENFGFREHGWPIKGTI